MLPDGVLSMPFLTVAARDKDPLPLRDAVRSSKRVWYANGPTAVALWLGFESVDEGESERSMVMPKSYQR